MPKKHSEDKIQEIIKLYQSGFSPKEIGNRFGIFNNSITRLLKKRGIARDQLIKITEDQAKEIIELYQNQKISSEIIAKKLGINGTTVCRVLKRNNIEIRSSTENKRKYKILENFFEVIDTEEKAYFLGLIYADGSLSKNGHGVKITLQDKDVDILTIFSNIIYGFFHSYKENRTLEDGSNRKYITVPIYCKKIYNDLIKLGATPQKTFTITFPNNQIVPDYLLHHFMRGYFDGDGCISISNLSRPVIDFTSNVKFVEGIKEYLFSKNIKSNKISLNKENESSANIQITNIDNIIKCYDLMYQDATIYMSRKFNIFQELFNYQKNNSKYGTTYIPSIDNNKLTSQYLKTLLPEEKEKIQEYLFKYYRENGFPYSNLTDNEIIKDFTNLKNADPISIVKDDTLTTFNQFGTSSFKHFSPHFYEVNSGCRKNKLSMLDTFNNDKLLKLVIKNRIDNNFNMTGNMLKQGLANSKVAYKASIYNSMIAKYIYSKYTKDQDIIYDYSMGFGQRLLAALSLTHHVTYIGIDPLERSIESNNNIYSFFNKNVPMLNKNYEGICIGSENYCDPKYIGKIALAFSCPPYFNIEKYEDMPSQAYFDNNYVNFINIWWRQTVKNIKSLLKENGIFALNIKEKTNDFNLGEDMCNVLKENDFKLLETHQVQLTKNIVFGNNKGEFKYEPIYIFGRNS